MTKQIDWIGGGDAASSFRDIASQRPSVAEQKAERALTLGRMCRQIPPHIKTGGSVNAVREWSAAMASASKVAANKRSSVAELDAAINNMARFFGG